jgi:hypothetical protein
MRAIGLTALVGFSVVLFARDAAAVSVKNFRELAAFYSSATGVPLTQPQVQTAYNNVKTRLPKQGTVDEFASPAVLGALELSGAFCNAFITVESTAPAASRRVHQTIDFAKTTRQLADADVLALAKGYARMFWTRDARPNEEAALVATITKLKTVTPDTTVGTKQLSLVLCTQAATSLDALVNR